MHHQYLSVTNCMDALSYPKPMWLCKQMSNFPVFLNNKIPPSRSGNQVNARICVHGLQGPHNTFFASLHPYSREPNLHFVDMIHNIKLDQLMFYTDRWFAHRIQHTRPNFLGDLLSRITEERKYMKIYDIIPFHCKQLSWKTCPQVYQRVG